MIKEKLVELGQDPRFDHDLPTLLGSLSDLGYDIDDDILLKATVLSSYYMAARYPGYRRLDFGEETAEEAYDNAVDIVAFLDTIESDEDR